MDESQSLDALANLLGELAEKPYDISLHAQHIRLAQSVEGMDDEVQAALEMLPQFLAADEDVWLALLRAKEAATNLETLSDVEQLLAMYARAEADYLSIPILQKHVEFILDRHAHYTGDVAKPEEFGELFSTEWTRGALTEVVNKGIGHLTQSHLIWDPWRDWELEMLAAAPASEKEQLAEYVQMFLLDRLRQPHSNSDETSQSYSSFTTNHKPPQDYESLLVAASKIRSLGVKAFDRREKSESSLAQSGFSLEAYAQYLAVERRAKTPDFFVLSAVFERAITEAAKRRFVGEQGAEEALRTFWIGYCDALRIDNAEIDVELNVLRRSVRSVPGSGEVWARYLRFLERAEAAGQALDGQETISNLYAKAFATNLIQSDVEQIVPVILARAGYERRRIEVGSKWEDAEDNVAILIGTLESGIEMVHQASQTGDVMLRLEKALADAYIRITSLPSGAINVWQMAVKHYKTSYLAWTAYTDILIKYDRYDQARTVFKDVHAKNLDWPEAIWEAWLSFEHLHGSVDDVESCLDKIEKARYQVNSRRAKEAEKAAYHAMQMAAEQQATNLPVAELPVPDLTSTAEVPMEVDVPRERGTKRGAEDAPVGEGSKKARLEQKSQPLKRDRENSTVFVADLPVDVTEAELTDLFKDCGKVREVKITQLTGTLVATVEFFERESVPSALTKDKKRIRDQEVAVHLAWKSTLYVTNFPEAADDAAMRQLFGEFGVIFDVRWPSKKFKNTRRFCYVQFTSPSSAESALTLHGRELEPGLPMSVLVSNPERKKERTDQDANERELYVAGLSKFTTQADLDKLFKTYGNVKEVRMATEPDGNCKGFAFVEFEEEKDARAALDANNHELKKRRIAVTLADSRVRARNRNLTSDAGLSQVAETRSRSVRIRNLPPSTQEGLLQQALEKIASVKRVEVFVKKGEALVELESAADAGKLLLRTEPIVFNGNTLKLSEEGRDGAPSRPAAPFVPRRAAAPRPKAGLGHSRDKGTKSGKGQVGTMGPPPPPASVSSQPSSSNSGKGQDDFRKMLG